MGITHASSVLSPLVITSPRRPRDGPPHHVEDEMLNERMENNRLEVGGSASRLAQEVGDDHTAAGASDWSTRLDRGQEVVHSNDKEANVRILSCNRCVYHS